MKTLAIMFGAALLVAVCGGGKDGTPPGNRSNPSRPRLQALPSHCCIGIRERLERLGGSRFLLDTGALLSVIRKEQRCM